MNMINMETNDYKGHISYMDVMENLKAINRVDQAYKYCRCDMCGYPRPDITTKDSYKMYFVELPSPDCKDMSAEEKEFIRLYGGYPEKPVPLCEDCLKELIQLFHSEMSEREDLPEYETMYTRRERVNAFLKWFMRNYWEIADEFGRSFGREHINNEAKTEETCSLLNRFFADCFVSASEVEGGNQND